MRQRFTTGEHVQRMVHQQQQACCILRAPQLSRCVVQVAAAAQVKERLASNAAAGPRRSDSRRNSRDRSRTEPSPQVSLHVQAPEQGVEESGVCLHCPHKASSKPSISAL